MTKIEQKSGNNRDTEEVEISYRSLGYIKNPPITTPMLKSRNMLKWAKFHLNDNWKKTLFSDETAFQLFPNTGTRENGQFVQD
ncbi:hypothetical protein G9A89_010256 [Geosiphon pyriformis]|nr:hypothetical protein G9A89_010256 [Geosiphon pyriformis]